MLALAARLFWLVFGNAALLFLAIYIARAEKFSLYDFAFWGVAASLVVVRLIDITLLGGRTAEGESATLSHWRRYVVIVLISSLLLWILAYQASPFIPK
jgi:hypothetical protein